MNALQHIILDNSLARVADKAFAAFLCHAFCHSGTATFDYNGQPFRFEAGDCLIIPSRGDLFTNFSQSDDFRVSAVYVSQEFIQMSTPQSNYGMKGQLALFNNPIMRLTPRMQRQCEQNFENIKLRLQDTTHYFHREMMMNAIQAMILDFFNFHATLYGFDSITSQYQQLMEQFLDMLERGDFRMNREIGYYADKLCVTPKYLSEVSKKISGLPASYWITRYTALDISRLLRDRNYSFTDIADLFNFSSLAHFSRYVLNNLGANPSDFRE